MIHDILSNLIITKVHSASTLFSPENKKQFFKDRTRWAIVMKYEGETVYHAHGQTYISNASRLTILPKGCTYRWECTRAGHFSIIEFDSPSSYPLPLSLPVKNSDKMLKSFKELEYKRNFKKIMGEMESIRDVYSILLMLAQQEQEKYAARKKQNKLMPALDYMLKSYNRPISNDELAALTGLSTVYFRKLFTECMGLPPMVYLHKLRIEKAKEMLRSDYGTLSDIAAYLGYANLYDFSRDFKKHTGVPPSRY